MALIAVVALSALLLGEVAGRLRRRGDPFAPLPESEVDPYRGNPYVVQFRPFVYSHIPRCRYTQVGKSYHVGYAINARGFRGPEIPPLPDPASKRLIVIGDSVVEGHGVAWDDALPSLLARRMRQSGWDVVGCGVLGASPLYYACNADRYLALHPDALLIVANDNDLPGDRALEASYSELPWLDPARLIPGLHSSLYDGLIRRSRVASRLDRLARSATHRFPCSDLERLIANHGARSRAKARTTAHSPVPLPFDEQMRMTEGYLDALLDRSRNASAQLLMAYVSLRKVAPSGAWGRKRQALMQDAGFARWAASRQVPYLSLSGPATERLRSDPEALTLPKDGHPSTLGHAWIASIVEPWLLRQL